MADPKTYRAIVEFRGFPLPDERLEHLERRIRDMLETHPTLSFAIDAVRVEEVTPEKADQQPASDPRTDHSSR